MYATWRTSAGSGPFDGGSDSDFLGLLVFNSTIVFSTAIVGRYSRSIDRERRRNQAILESLPDLMTVSRGHNRRVERLSSLDAGSEPEASELERAIVERIVELDVPFEGPPIARVEEVTDDSGRVHHIESRSVRVDRSQVVTVSRNVTPQVQLLAELREAQVRWQRLANTAYEGFLEVDRTLRVTYASDRFVQMLGRDLTDVIGEQFPRLFDPKDWPRFEPYALEVLGGARVTFETWHTRINGSRGWVIISGEPILGGDGEFDGAIMFAADTTAFHNAALGQAEAELRLASVERLERQRIARALHDGPLQTLVAMSYHLNSLANGADVEATSKRLEAMTLEATKRMRGTLEDLVPPKLSEGELVGALAQVAGRFQSEGGPAIITNDDTTTTMPEAAALLLFRTGREAVTNAILHGNAQTVWVEVSEAEGGYELVVTDDGSGFDHDRLGEFGGHMGLYTMRQRATEAGGRCFVAPMKPSGTRVSIWSPRHPSELAVVGMAEVGESRP